MVYDFKLCIFIFVVVVITKYVILSAAVRLSESHYRVKSSWDNNMRMEDFRLLSEYTNADNHCLPARIHQAKKANSVEELQRFSVRESVRISDSTLSGCSIYVDPSISSELRNKVKLCFGEQIPRYFVIILAILKVFHMRIIVSVSSFVLVKLAYDSSALFLESYMLCIV